MIKAADIFQKTPNRKLDFSSGKIDMFDMFNNGIVPFINELAPEEEALGDPFVQNAQAGVDQVIAQNDKLLSDTNDSILGAREQAAQFGFQNQAPSNSRDEVPKGSMFDMSKNQVSQQSNAPVSKEGFTMLKSPVKLANYGYDSDLSPDYNSNVLRIGNRNNKLVDGQSAAITASFAKKHGIKAGQSFEILTSDGKVQRRTYDDTVPPTYKGKALPETIDLYERGGSNNFGGKIVGLKLLAPKKSK